MGERTEYRPSRALEGLGGGFWDVVAPARFPRHQPRFWNARWAARVGLGGLTAAALEAHFARFEPLPGSLAAPLAMRYHGHQFRTYNPHIGDGRGFTFAQLHDGPADGGGRLLDLGTKGSGPTPWARHGDGRLTLQGGVREVLAAELLEALGVDTCKIMSVYETGEGLIRGDEPSPTRSCVMVRLAHSHIRVGTFQRHAYERRADRVERLLLYVAEHHYPALPREDLPILALNLVTEVTRRLARLAASWTIAGFAHGVLNTDNTNLTGESFDYGPWRFVPTCDPGFVAAYFDHTGLFAFGRQPQTLLWNVARLCDALSLLADREILGDAAAGFEVDFRRALADRCLFRLGLAERSRVADDRLAMTAVDWLVASQVPYDRFWFDWFGGVASEARAMAGPLGEAYGRADFAPVRAAMAEHRPRDRAALADPYFAGPGPCGLLDDEVRAIWAAIADADDWGPFERKVAAIRHLGALNGVTLA